MSQMTPPEHAAIVDNMATIIIGYPEETAVCAVVIAKSEIPNESGNNSQDSLIDTFLNKYKRIIKIKITAGYSGREIQ